MTEVSAVATKLEELAPAVKNWAAETGETATSHAGAALKRCSTKGTCASR